MRHIHETHLVYVCLVYDVRHVSDIRCHQELTFYKEIGKYELPHLQPDVGHGCPCQVEGIKMQ